MTHDSTEDRLEPLQTHRRPILKLAPYTLLGTITLTQTTTVTAQDHNTVFHDFETQEINHEYTPLYGSHSEWDTDHHDDLNNRTAHVTSNNERPSFLILNPDTYEWYDRQASIDFKVNTQNWKRNARLAFVSGNNAWIITAAVQGDKIGIQYDAGITGNWTQVASYDYTITDTEPHTLHGWLSEDRIIAGIDDTQQLLEHEIDESITLGSVGFGVHGDIPVETWFDRFSVESWSKPSHPPQSGEQEIAAEITQFDTYGGEVDYGETVESRATVENTGDVEHTFFVGYSMFGPNGEEYNNDGGTGKPVPIQPGETKTVELQWEVRPGIPSGSYKAVTTVWEESDKSNLETDLHTRENPDAVRLYDDTINIEITDVQVQTETAEPGDDVQSTVVVQNNDNDDQRCYIGYSVIAPDGRVLDNEGTTGRVVTLEAGERTTVDVSWLAPSTEPSGVYDTVTAIWAEADRDALETRLDQVVMENAFELVDGDLPPGASILSPVKPSEFPYEHAQELVYEGLGPDRDGVEGIGIRVHVDREFLSEDRVKISVLFDSPNESLLEEFRGYGSSQLLVMFDENMLSVDPDAVRSQVNGGTPQAVEVGSNVMSLASLVTGPAASIKEAVREFVKTVALEVAEEWVTSRLNFETPPSFGSIEETSVLVVDFATETVPEATSPVAFDEYGFEAEFIVEDPDVEPTVSVVADLRGQTRAIFTPLEKGGRITIAKLQTHQYPVEYRRQIDVAVDRPKVTEDSADPLGDVDDDMPGFGVGSALAGLGGAAYLLRRRLTNTNSE